MSETVVEHVERVIEELAQRQIAAQQGRTSGNQILNLRDLAIDEQAWLRSHLAAFTGRATGFLDPYRLALAQIEVLSNTIIVEPEPDARTAQTVGRTAGLIIMLRESLFLLEELD